MKQTKGLIGLLVFVGCLWAVVVTTYAAQVQNQAFDGKQTALMPMQNTSCSSSSSSSGE